MTGCVPPVGCVVKTAALFHSNKPLEILEPQGGDRLLVKEAYR